MTKRKFKKEKIGKVTEADIAKVLSKVSREVFGIHPSKKHKNKKKYSRKVKHKENLDSK